MEAIRQVMRIPKEHEITIKVPDNIPDNETVEVILIFKGKRQNFKQKVKELKHAMNDSIFLNDMSEVSEDFNVVDSEELE